MYNVHWNNKICYEKHKINVLKTEYVDYCFSISDALNNKCQSLERWKFQTINLRKGTQYLTLKQKCITLNKWQKILTMISDSWMLV